MKKHIFIKHCKSSYLLTQFSIMLLDMSLMRFSRCLANSSSGQCKSLMKVWRASSFQKRSSDVPEPLLPSSQTHISQKVKDALLQQAALKLTSGRGFVVAGAEEDAVPVHPKILLSPYTDCSIQMSTSPSAGSDVFGQSVYGWKGVGRVYGNKSITTL